MTDQQNDAKAPFPLDRDHFMRLMLRELTGTLESVVGLAESSGFISLVGQRIGEHLSDGYRQDAGDQRLSLDQVADALVDLKRRIGGDFYLIEDHRDRLVLGNRACPFGKYVDGRPSLCMMTSNVFGTITADNPGQTHRKWASVSVCYGVTFQVNRRS